MSCMAQRGGGGGGRTRYHAWASPYDHIVTRIPLQSRDGARRVSTEQADIASTEPRGGGGGRAGGGGKTIPAAIYHLISPSYIL